MSDRHIAYTVILEKDIKDEDSEKLINAIQMLKGVMSVVPKIAEYSDYLAEERAKMHLRKELFDVLCPEWAKK